MKRTSRKYGAVLSHNHRPSNYATVRLYETPDTIYYPKVIIKMEFRLRKGFVLFFYHSHFNQERSSEDNDLATIFY